MTTTPFLEQFQQQETDNIALSIQLNRWSLILIEQMIREQEAKLVASDLPVDIPGDDAFWEQLG